MRPGDPRGDDRFGALVLRAAASGARGFLERADADGCVDDWLAVARVARRHGHRALASWALARNREAVARHLYGLARGWWAANAWWVRRALG